MNVVDHLVKVEKASLEGIHSQLPNGVPVTPDAGTGRSAAEMAAEIEASRPFQPAPHPSAWRFLARCPAAIAATNGRWVLAATILGSSMAFFDGTFVLSSGGSQPLVHVGVSVGRNEMDDGGERTRLKFHPRTRRSRVFNISMMVKEAHSASCEFF